MTTEEFTTTDTWTAPAGVTSVEVECWGGGGGGGGGRFTGDPFRYAGSGGGGGAYAKETIAVTPGNTYDVVVGAGGSGGAAGGGGPSNDGAAGGDTYFDAGADVLAKGGSPGLGGDPGAPAGPSGGSGGQASSSVGSTKSNGGDGGAAYNDLHASNNRGGGGGGAAGSSGAGGAGGDAGSTSPGLGGTAGTGGGDGGDAQGFVTAGDPGAAPGGGGAGGQTVAGGDGAAGKIVLTYTVGAIEATPPHAATRFVPRTPAVHSSHAQHLDGALGSTGAEPPINAELYRTRFVPGQRPVRARSPVTRIGSPLQHTGIEQPLPVFHAIPRFVPGARSRHRSQVFRAAPHMIDWARRYLTTRGRYRVFNAAEYRFYRSNSAPPVEGDSPWATSSSLPDTPTDTFADGTWYLSSSYFNGAIDSGFLALGPNGETYLELEIASAAEVSGRPTPPADVRLELRPNGVVRVVAFVLAVGDAAPDTWAIAYTTDGSTPAADAPDVTQSISGGALKVLAYDLPAQADATTVKVRLQTRLSGVYSSGSSVLTATADAAGPAAPADLDLWPGIPSEE